MINRVNQAASTLRLANTKAAILTSLLLGVMALSLVTPPWSSAQTIPGLDIQLHAGLSITGAVVTVYSIEYVTDLAQTNSWRCLE